MFTVPDLTRLARLYCAAKQISPSTLGKISCRNNRVFVRLFSEDQPRLFSDTAERASSWLVENWPADLAWPSDIPHPGNEDPFRRTKLNGNARLGG